MKKTLFIAVLFLGFSSASFAQGKDDDCDGDGGKCVSSSIIIREAIVILEGNYQGKNLIVADNKTGIQSEIIIKNPNVTVVLGEVLTILIAGADDDIDKSEKEIAVNDKGEFVGQLIHSYLYYYPE